LCLIALLEFARLEWVGCPDRIRGSV
jgi:hypothetical protein